MCARRRARFLKYFPLGFEFCFGWCHNHHHVELSARISLTLSCHPLSPIDSGRTSGIHPVSTQSCCMSVRAGRPAFARPCEGVHKCTSLMSSSLLVQQCPTCLVHLILIVWGMGGRWLYRYSFVGCCLRWEKRWVVWICYSFRLISSASSFINVK